MVRIDGNANQGNAGGDPGKQGKQDSTTAGPNAPVRTLTRPADGSPGMPFAAPAGSTTANVTSATNLNATSAPAPSSAVQLPPPVVQVAQTVIDQVNNGGGEARIHLHPAELGDVLIRVRTDGDKVHVEVHADRADAQQLLRDHTQDLSNLLGSRGLNLGDVNIGFGGRGAGNAGHDAQPAPANTPGSGNGEFAALMGAGDAPGAGLHNRLQSAYNPDGALSYRI
ncbi:MAG TPA: flagellar hook-length control protein FliK [Tepidiformaceae bacterium]|nr:flagellar hook-length control protein FliK [Tepidiformaceae bacterium]